MFVLLKSNSIVYLECVFIILKMQYFGFSRVAKEQFEILLLWIKLNNFIWPVIGL